MFALFFFYSLCVLLAWCRQKRLAIGLFIAFLLLTTFVFTHHITNQLSLQF
jgi:peptidoglycan/LPS O-acetylase OafA/YrhL